jgi:hypothetical protein
LLSSSALLAQTPAHSVKDNGATGDGRAHDTAPLQSSLNLGGTIYLPPGTYLISKNLIIGSHTTVQGPGTIEAIRPGIASILIEGHAENPTNVSHANLVLKHLRVVQRSDQKGTQLWASGPVSNVSATGQVPVPFSTNIPITYPPQ